MTDRKCRYCAHYNHNHMCELWARHKDEDDSCYYDFTPDDRRRTRGEILSDDSTTVKEKREELD